MGQIQLAADEAWELARCCLEANGCDVANARAVADTMTAAERDGSAGHGLLRLPGYVASLRSGKVRFSVSTASTRARRSRNGSMRLSK